MSLDYTPELSAGARSGKFLVNVGWTWLGIVANLFNALVLSPYVIRKLGADGYGLWTLLFSFIAYYNIADLGFRSALIYYAAHFRAKGDWESVNVTINTILFYYSAAAIVLVTLGFAFAARAPAWFHVSPQHERDFSILVMLLSVNCLLGINVFGATLEGFQRFDLSSRVYVATLVLRAAGSVTILASGFGLLELGLNYLAIQIIGVTACYFALRRAFPALRLSFDLIRLSMLRRMASYGVHSFVANVGSQFLSQSPPVLIGLYLPNSFVGYFSLPYRIMQYAVDIVVRAGGVTNSSAVELAASSNEETLVRLGIYSNRYSFMLFVPLLVFLFLYGPDLIRVWIGEEFLLHSAPLLPILAVANAVAIGGQFNTSAMLFSLKRHKEYGRSLVVESAISVAAMLVAIPRFGILGVAWATAIPMLLIRGIYAPFLLCRALNTPLWAFLRSIYVSPALTGIPALALAWVLKTRVLSGGTWQEILAAAALIAIAYFALAAFTCLDAGHRRMFLRLVANGLRRGVPARPQPDAPA